VLKSTAILQRTWDELGELKAKKFRAPEGIANSLCGFDLDISITTIQPECFSDIGKLGAEPMAYHVFQSVIARGMESAGRRNTDLDSPIIRTKAALLRANSNSSQDPGVREEVLAEESMQ
jgi:hypothetical protein